MTPFVLPHTASGGDRRPTLQPGCDDPGGLVIGLVNIMPDGALAATERQFRAVLSAAAPGRRLRLRLLTLPGIPRGEYGRAHLGKHYEVLGHGDPGRLDGLIVTGAQPSAACLHDEPFWAPLTALVDWAADGLLPVVWSCLSAHAAVQHRDGIVRLALPRKLLGVFDCDACAAHPLTAALPRRWPVPHSRYNGLDPAQLTAAGYRILSRSDTVGADMFVNDALPNWLFLQGHPEYERETIMLEYRRDLRQGRDVPMPEGYFTPGAEPAAGVTPESGMLRRCDWRNAAAGLFAGWIAQLTSGTQVGARARWM